MGTVVCTSTHPVDLDDGRELSPGATAEDVDTLDPHNAGLILDGSLVVTEGSKPRTRKEDRLVAEAAKPQEAAVPGAPADTTKGKVQN
jgi:hypothetical protein